MDIIYGKSNKVVEGRSTTLYTYTATGRFKSVVDALGRKETYEYDQYGRLKTKTDRDNYATTYEYNNAGVVTKVGYADGRSVAFSYNELNQLSQINDWYGKTILENDILGRLTKVTDFKNRTVAYEYGATGERTKLIYPDGREVTYNYDEKLQLSSIIGNGEETRYIYDDLGRLSSKTFANGVTQGYTYMPGGNLASMESSDEQGVLDKYFYSYNKAGLIDGIDRNRRGLDKVSGRYEYSYDAIGRLTKTTHDGITKASYEYDAFGNRTAMSEIAADTSENIKTAYTYDVLDRLIETKELNSSQAILKTYDYDNRGNQTKEFINGILQKSFTFDATNMLSKVIDKDKGELENFYNGLGFRVASTRPEERIDYLCNLSKDYYNLLERTVNGETESFVYDNNVISMSKSGNNFYYLQDELGSPMYMTGTDGVVVSAYAFDDFGRNIYPFTGKVRNNRNQNASNHAYTTNGNIIQPFAFTGYQEDEVSGLKFAQARFYSADNGRFVGEDQIKGFIDSVDTQHRYMYCLNNPRNLIDENGKEPSIPDPTPTLSNQSSVGFYPESKSDVGFYPAPESNSMSTSDSAKKCEGEDSGAGITSKDVSTISKYVQNGVEILKIGLLAGAKVLSRRSKQISAMLHSAKIARPGRALSHYRSNNAVRRSMREAAAKNLSNAEKATNIAKKIDDYGKYINVVAVALGVGLAVSTVVTGLSDDLKIYKGKSLRDLTKDAMYYSIKHWKPALL